MKEDWEYKKFEDALQKVKYTKKLQTSEFLSEGSIPIISQEEEFISGYWNNTEDSFKVDTPVVIFGDHSRVLKYVDFDFVLGADGVKILKPIEGLLAKYLYNYLKWYNIPNMGYSRHYKFLKEITLPIPSIAEQQQIVSELDLLSGVIEKQKAQLEELDKLAQSIFYDMFGDPVTNEKGWLVTKYGDEFKISSGGTPSKSNSEYWEGGDIPWIGSNMCQNCIIYENDGKFITEKGLKGSSADILMAGTVLIALVGATIGKVALLQKEMATNQNIANINVSDNNNFEPIFIFYHSMNLYQLFINLGDGGFKMANQGFIRELPLILPPLSLQQEFASKIEAIESMKAKVRQSLSEAETLFNSRMDYYFN